MMPFCPGGDELIHHGLVIVYCDIDLGHHWLRGLLECQRTRRLVQWLVPTDLSSYQRHVFDLTMQSNIMIESLSATIFLNENELVN